MLLGRIPRPQQWQQSNSDGHHTKYIDVKLSTDVRHFLEFDRTWRKHDAGVVDQTMQNSVSGLFPDTVRQFGNVLFPCNIANHRVDIALASGLHPFGIVFRTHRRDDAVTSLCKGTSSTKAKATAGTRDKDRFC